MSPCKYRSPKQNLSLFINTSSGFIFKLVINICNVTLEHVYQMMSQHLGIKATVSKKATLRTYAKHISPDAIKIRHSLQELVISEKTIKGGNCKILKLPCHTIAGFGFRVVINQVVDVHFCFFVYENCQAPTITSATFHDISRLLSDASHHHWALTAGSVKTSLETYLTYENRDNVINMYAKVSIMAHQMINSVFNNYQKNGQSFSTWGSISPQQNEVLTKNPEDTAAWRHIALNRFQESWVAHYILSQKWRSAIQQPSRVEMDAVNL
ncbi:hypothetical protein PHYBLDRAFT_172075 [Phycomyces blakesleeanus NRRL 1555(-)]|uniref:Uncharacterized protein n=1 Tax=Phycomyces blakesleeanus (strain ATCC 8743b / DSM 1359 / FGSC 10004 / NBRC 33097 / NRRL 1555) TaxID=763407 RepID=A0A167L2F0_PHYB8|nr:hypothetical protein PHYBLDRAFT_172075 [Phycomyces blakesleeanus NRRL 1555(-)]OAD69436.1 hypothetical protein PHYBLDRAFT_172075 [Phycomyces blakesleeanus NRRL 1555(-)]|eukprot:XP_018287476.1 hypothetical protein PHYBLDRAFT_172075 [Phycomyces blakesleeanus NRRL 1555(-)]